MSKFSWSDILDKADGYDALVAFSEHTDEQAQDLLQKYFETLSQAKSIKLWTTIESAVKQQVNVLKSSIVNGSELSEHMRNLNGAVEAIKLFLSNSNYRFPRLLLILSVLNQLLGDIDEESAAVSSFKNLLSQLCESYISAGETGCETLLPQTITYLLRETLQAEPKDNSLKRLLAIKHGFQLLDFTRTDSSFSRELLVRCFVHPRYLKCAEARKLLADLLALSDGIGFAFFALLIPTYWLLLLCRRIV